MVYSVLYQVDTGNVVIPPPGFVEIPFAGTSSISNLPAAHLTHIATAVTPSEAPLSRTWTVNGAAEQETGRVQIEVPREVVWTGTASRSLAANASLTVTASADGVFDLPVTPILGTDYTVSVGEIINVELLPRRFSKSQMIRFIAGPAGATFGDLQLRARLIDEADEVSVRTVNVNSVAAYGRQGLTAAIWPYISVASGQALTDAIVARRADPRRAWVIVIDGDRNAATNPVSREAALGIDLGDRVTVDLDADFSLDAEIVSIAHQITGAAGNLQTRLGCLAAESGITPTPLATVPLRPDRPQLTQRTISTVLATVAPPGDGGSAITSYDWRWRPTLTLPAWDEVQVSNPTFLFTGLAPNVEYEVQVRAENAIGPGPWSLSARITTDTGGARYGPRVPRSVYGSARFG